MNTLDKNALIAELEEINQLYNERCSIEMQINSLSSQRDAEEKSLVKPRRIPRTIKNKYLKKLINRCKSEEEKLDLVHIMWYVPRHWASKEKFKDFESEKKLNQDTTPEANEKRYEAFRIYDKMFLTIAEEYKKNYTDEQERYNAEEAKYQDELKAIEVFYRNKAKELTAEKQDVVNKLNKVTIISKDFIPDAERIANMLKQGRADTLKEAINLVCDEKRKDAEEAARRVEAAIQEEILLEQAEAMQRAAEEQARATREHNAAMERAAQAQNDILKKSAESQQRAASARCNTCANRFTCSYERKQAYSCSSYRSI